MKKDCTTCKFKFRKAQYPSIDPCVPCREFSNWELATGHPKDSSPLNSQVGGNHYVKLGQYQPWIVASKWMTPDELRGAMKATAIIYLAREGVKGGIEDIRKAVHTLQIYLELVDPESTKE